MPRDQLDVVREAFEALNRRDGRALEALMEDQAEWRPLLTAGGELERRVYRGPAGLMEYWRDLDALFEETRLQPVHLEAVGDRHVLFAGRAAGRGSASGVPVDIAIWALFEVRDGRIAGATGHRTEAEARQAASA